MLNKYFNPIRNQASINVNQMIRMGEIYFDKCSDAYV